MNISFKIIVTLLICFTSTLTSTAQRRSEKKVDPQLAYRFFQNQEYEKAASLFNALYQQTSFKNYFDFYISCLVKTPDHEEAIKAAKKEFKRKKGQPAYEITLAYVLESTGQLEEAKLHFENILQHDVQNRNDVLNLANSLYSYRKYELALKLYDQGASALDGEQFYYEKAKIFRNLKNWDKMIDEYLLYLSIRPKALRQVQSQFQNSMVQDVDGELKAMLRKKIIGSMQRNPNVLVYQKLLLWYLMQNQEYDKALENAIALDRRTKDQASLIIRLCDLAASEGEFEKSLEACDYLLKKAMDKAVHPMVEQKKLNYSYKRFLTLSNPSEEQKSEVLELFRNYTNDLTQNSLSLQIFIDFSQLLLFSFNNAKDAKAILENLENNAQFKPEQQALVKMNLARIAVYEHEFFEANYLYNQIHKSTRGQSISDEATFSKAKLGMYMGNFAWSKTVLDVLKSSTSKLIANDAMDLAQLLKENLVENDTVNAAMQLYADTDRLLYCHQLDSALNNATELLEQYASHSIAPSTTYLQAEIYLKKNVPEETERVLKTIVENYPFSNKADDALFELAQLLSNIKGRENEAKNYYKQLIIDYPGSIYTPMARQKYNLEE